MINDNFGITSGIDMLGLTWLLFAKTGEMGYYMLYSELKDKQRSIFD